VNAFTPVVLTGESIDRAGGVDGLNDIVRRYIPLVREVDQYSQAVRDQSVAAFEGAAPEYQFQSYLDGLKETDRELEPFATALGYASVDGLLASDVGRALFKDDRERNRSALADQFPTGFQMAQRFENDDAINSRALIELARKPDRSAAEDHMLAAVELIERWKNLGEILQLDASVSGMFAAQELRKKASAWASDRRFVELWDRFLAREFGPIAQVA
jgi:hypothetical protein